jgi:amino acid transporter
VAAQRGTGLADGVHDELSGGDVLDGTLPETLGYKLKRKLLGPPLVNEQISEEKLSRPLALGVLSCDGISSAAYGTEEMLIELVPIVGVAAFTLILPVTLVILAGVGLVVLSYREVVSVYTRAGGSYVVARENFGPRVAQVAAVALLIDYTVTVAVQTAAGSAAIVSAFPQLANIPVIGPYILIVISVIAVSIMCFGNLRGIREAGRTFALPTYLFSGAVGLMIVVGLVREVTVGLPHVSVYPGGAPYPIGHSTEALLSFGMIYMLAKSFANGGSSLTGIEAVSNAVSALRPPEGRNARQILVTQGSIVAFLIAGISWLSHVTHAIPYLAGYPTVLAQEANTVFGSSAHFMYFVVQAATALILFTGGNTSFSGFPFLASFVAGDSFLPRWLTKRGHRLALSNGIIVLTVVSLILLVSTKAQVNGLVPFYAIGVFTGFSLAGFGMAKYHKRVKEPGWRRRLVINRTAAIYTAIVVVIFAVVKFTEGAWVIVIVFPALVFLLIRLNREYRMEAEVLENIGDRPAGISVRQPNYSRRVVLIFVDSVDLATFAAIKYARGLRPTTMRAVHFVVDSAQAENLREKWVRYGQGIPLEMIDTPDRRLLRAAVELVGHEAAQQGTNVTVVLPRRSFSPLIGRLLHDRTADKIAAVVSQVPNSAATIIPFDVESRVQVLHARQAARVKGNGAGGEPDRSVRAKEKSLAASAAAGRQDGSGALPPAPPDGVTPIGALGAPGKASVVGRVRAVEIRPVEQNCVFKATVADSTGSLTAMFYGRTHIPGVEPGARLRLDGKVSMREGGPAMINPAYQLLPKDGGE